ncbi:MAG: TonB-dependent receptor [Bacteroidetes bacterium]|nr:TonB-dependent receptor [Bacteroidota bacterium]
MRYFLGLSLLFSSFFSFSQNNLNPKNGASLTGKIIDSTNAQPIDYATVSIYQDGNINPVNGATSNNKGLFVIDNLMPGNYHAIFDFVGYDSKTIKGILISKPGSRLNLGNIALSVSAKTLAGVVVTGRKNLIENKIDKMVFNAERDITSQGGVATDLLKKIPMISVDVDGNVELQGNSNIRFLINGKPSSIFGNSLADALQSIPASQIKSIEVVTSPGAKYDAEGTGGIINIILKDSKIQGVNGNINLSAGSRLENGSINLNARKNNIGFSSYFSGNGQLFSTTLKKMDRTSFDSLGNISGKLTQNGQYHFHRSGFQTGIGMDWSINKKNSINGGIGYHHFGYNSNGIFNQEQLLYDNTQNLSADQYLIAHSHNYFLGQSLDWNLNYKKTFAQEGKSFDLLYSSSYGKNNSNFDQYQNSSNGDTLYTGSYSNNQGVDQETDIQADYEQPLTEKIKIEAGGKTVIKKITSNTLVNTLDPSTNIYNTDTTQSNSLLYNRDVYAAYGAIAFPILHFFDAKSGLRYERTNTAAQFSKVAHVQIPDYDTWAPSFILSHSFKSNETIKVSYTRRIQRPSYQALNPYINATDPKNISTGNPLLKPEIANRYELAYIKPFEKGGSLNIVFFYHQSSDDIQPFIQYYPSYKIGDSVYNNVSVSTSENIGVENNYGLNFYESIPLTQKLNIRSNLSLFDRYIINKLVPGSNISSFNYRININATYQLNDDFVMEVFGNFNSPRNEVQGRYPSFTSYNFAFRKQLWHKKGSIGFTTTNPFNNYVQQNTTVTGQGFALNSYRQMPFRSFGVSFIRKFGKLEFKKDKDQNTNNMGGEENN